MYTINPEDFKPVIFTGIELQLSKNGEYLMSIETTPELATSITEQYEALGYTVVQHIK